MKKLEIKKFNFKKLLSKQKGSDWQRSVYVILVLSTFGLLGMLAYIYFSAPSEAIVEQVKNEVSNDSIRIDVKTLELIKNKEYLK